MSDRERSPSETRTEMTWIVMPGQTNALGTVFGGQVMAWVDVCAAVAAQRFCHSNVVTAEMDSLTFKGPIQKGQIAVIRAQVNWAGRTSMEVGVRVDAEDPLTGVRTHTSTCYLTFVALGDDREKVQVPRLRLETPDDERRHQEASERREARLARRKVLAERRGGKA